MRMLLRYSTPPRMLFTKVLPSSCKNSFRNIFMAAVRQLKRVSYETLGCRCCRSISVLSGDVPMSVPGGGSTNMHPNSRRNYQIVVAATHEMGIGKDGKLPWRLPSDLKFFKELTSTTSSPEKKNAVVMGRKTWESIPPKYRPLPGRLNVVLTRSGSFGSTTAEDIVICGSVPSALKLLAEEPYSFSIEKVFVIGGGQIFRETMNAPGCDAIHITEIETSTECDTFIPAIDLSLFFRSHSSPPVVENNIRYSFVTYVRAENSDCCKVYR